jgi:hypothetical protein
MNLQAQAVKELQGFEVSSAVLMSGATETSYVYDADENKLMYNRVTGMVFSSAGVVYNQDSQPLTYDDSTKQFEDSLQRRLDLVERSTGGLQNYYLMFGDYKVRSIGINDELYLVGIAANTAFNSGPAYDMLITRVYVSEKWWQIFIPGNQGYYEYYNLYGHQIDSKYLQHTVKPNLIAGAGTSSLSGTVLTKFEKWGTIQDLLDEIVFLMELVPPSGSPMGEFALNTVTGAYLRDDRNQKIRIKDGQLIDPMGWPLIGADARPLWWKESIRAYTNHKGGLLEYGQDNTLTDGNGFIAHSVISNVIAGQRIYLIYLADGKTLIPATLKTISTNPYKAEYYDMNGERIELDEIVEPEISVDDREENWPDEFQSAWEEFKAFIASVWEFLKDWGLLILLGLVIILTLPATLPLVISLFKWIAKGIVALGRGIVALVTLPVRLFKRER